jgi:hypothetical protein
VNLGIDCDRLDEPDPEGPLTGDELIDLAVGLAAAATELWAELSRQPGVLANPDIFRDVRLHVNEAANLLPSIYEMLVDDQTRRLRASRAQIDALQTVSLRSSRRPWR